MSWGRRTLRPVEPEQLPGPADAEPVSGKVGPRRATRPDAGGPMHELHEMEEVVVGIAVAKAALGVAVRPQGAAQRLAHDAARIARAGRVPAGARAAAHRHRGNWRR
jgi:hypothetical protein